MIRAVVVLVSTLAFTLVGLLIGWMASQSYLRSLPNDGRGTELVLLASFGVAPLTGAVIGFAGSIFVIWLFAIPLPRASTPHEPA